MQRKNEGYAGDISKVAESNRAILPERFSPMHHAEYLFVRIKVTVGMLLSNTLSSG
jgi:hypothetical protein